MEQIIWSDGDKFEKTKKKDKPIVNSKNEIVKKEVG